MTLWNPTVHQVVHYFRVPVTRSYTVRDSTGQPILAQVDIFVHKFDRLSGDSSPLQYRIQQQLFLVDLAQQRCS